LFDALDRAVARRVDVRLLLWRPNPESYGIDRTFWGSAADRELLARRSARFKIRWDRLPGRYCHHQKTWTIDAGQPTEVAFVGGANMSVDTLKRHDVFVEIVGPSATDVHHNFVQRWNAASEREQLDGNWACDPTDTMAFPERLSPRCGSTTVQVQRMMPPGEHTILDQYERAIDAAQRTIYLENQAIPVPRIADRLLQALDRGVDVVLVVPAAAEAHVIAARRDPAEQGPFDSLEALGRRPNFLLAGIAEPGGHRPKYVHAKIMMIDGVWVTIGSCNLHRFSLFGHSEMNAAIWDEAVVRDLRCRLFRDHLGTDTSDLDDGDAVGLFRRLTLEHRPGAAFALAPGKYALT
jgi:phosphatidylserine/phosphatidylglycerophosphate/cardiolipin synthase-like enzyme